MSPGASSTTWADGPEGFAPGTVVGGFRIDRLIGGGPDGAVYEATQLSLGRTVALRILGPGGLGDPEAAARFDAQQLLSASLHHPNVIPTYEAGEWEGGRFVATRFIRGRTLEDLLAAGARPRGLEDPLSPIADALEAAHDAGLVHGRLTARNVFVGAAGTVHLADLGLGRPGSAEADRRALSELEDRIEREWGRARPPVPPLLVAAAALTAIGALVLALVLGSGDEADPDADPPPPAAAGTVQLGSELAAGPADSLGCSGEPGPNTPPCTLSPVAIAGRPVTVARAGVIRSWAVRGAEGDLALQVVGRRDGEVSVRGFSQVERPPDPGPHTFEANLAVRPGDQIGVLLSPGAAIGARAGTPGTAAIRWEGSLPFAPAPQRSSRVETEILLRADVELGARPDLPQVTGSRAARLPSGASLAEQVVIQRAGIAVRVALVRADGAIAIDAFRGGRRLARAEILDAKPDGRTLALESGCGFRHGLCLRWLNPGAELPVVHAYRLTPGGDAFLPIG